MRGMNGTDPISTPPTSTPIHEHNRRAWDARAEAEQRFAKPIGDNEFAAAIKELQNDPWLTGAIQGKRLLCLGSGGGRRAVERYRRP